MLEQILPEGPNHPFSQTMLRHFDKLKTPPRSVREYPTLHSQESRFTGRGWQSVNIWDLWQVWTSEEFVSGTERSNLDLIEPFDEWEELVLFARHYFLMHAVASTPQCDAKASQIPKANARGEGAPYRIHLQRLRPEGPKRRFGTSLTISDPNGRDFLLNIMGLGVSGRADSYDIYSLHGQVHPPQVSRFSPAPRMCHTLTDLGDYGFLLAGGRNSPKDVLSDCWILSKGNDCVWSAVPGLPTPLFRHSAIRLRGTSLAFVTGGKTGPSQISERHYLFHPQHGWLDCDVVGKHPTPSFGNFVCNTSPACNTAGDFTGLLAGGIGRDGCILDNVYSWKLDTNAMPVSFQRLSMPLAFKTTPSRPTYYHCSSIVSQECLQSHTAHY